MINETQELWWKTCYYDLYLEKLASEMYLVQVISLNQVLWGICMMWVDVITHMFMILRKMIV